MSSSYTHRSALVLTGSLLIGGSVLMGSALASPGMNQETVLQTVTPLSPTFNSYLLASSGDHDRAGDREQQRNKDGMQENNAGSEDSQPAEVPTTWVRPAIMENENRHD